MKHIDADILRTKITGLCANANFCQQKAMEESNREDFVSFGGEIFAYAKVFSLIDSLQQERPEVDLENEFADFLEKKNAYVDDNNKISYYNGSSFDHASDIYPIACHFYELGLNARKEE